MKRTALLLLLALTPAFAALESETKVRALGEAFIAKAVAGDYDGAFQLISPHWPLPQEELEGLAAQTVGQMAQVKQRFGATVGSEALPSTRIGDTFLRLLYLQKFEKHAVRWQLIFYRAEEDWIVNQVMWDDDIDALFDEVGVVE